MYHTKSQRPVKLFCSDGYIVTGHYLPEALAFEWLSISKLQLLLLTAIHFEYTVLYASKIKKKQWFDVQQLLDWMPVVMTLQTQISEDVQYKFPYFIDVQVQIQTMYLKLY